jgi:hypothetical protein
LFLPIMVVACATDRSVFHRQSAFHSLLDRLTLLFGHRSR